MNGFNPFEKNKSLFDVIDYPESSEFMGTFMDKTGKTFYGLWDRVGDGEYHSIVWDLRVTQEDGDFVEAKLVE